MKATDNIVKLAKELCEKEIERTITLLKGNEEKWNEYMDLKLHDCAVIDDLEIEENSLKITVNNVYETAVEEILLITKCVYNEIEDALADIITVYDRIKNFKDNQVEYYKDYIRNEVINRLAE